MRFQIIRFYEPRQTKGEAAVIDDNGEVLFACKTLELPWLDNKRRISCIPKGLYHTIKHQSPKYGECFWLTNVKDRSGILIHHGNFAASKNPRTGKPDTLGCILPGQAFADIDGDGYTDVTSSKPTLRKLLKLLPGEFLTEIH
jgi:hypothetical protein